MRREVVTVKRYSQVREGTKSWLSDGSSWEWKSFPNTPKAR